jgi:hypothetical protein
MFANMHDPSANMYDPSANMNDPYNNYYRIKYIKYKLKYIKLRQQLGGNTIDEDIATYTVLGNDDGLRKLEQIKEKLYNLENDIEVKKELPQYYTIQNFRNAPHLTFDRRIDDKRHNLKMKMKENKSLTEELERFNEKLKKKYPKLFNETYLIT